ncbi:acyl-ACP--UDP-N- acetylglucosamine O-acyltransferase [Agromyces agglutinans]|uniref:acyl-ACP--UDP-N- acetylglucosamine O-acyltransferase n=1 Tax=Agromyces agglutinans TaxID=2662258 RepID=UPI0012995D9D|nr:acyl-ACP--UDP-N- acetylglucosamine O-acyltransferase [Agromyces agglutinans]
MNTIHPTAVITGDVRLGERNVVGPFAVITGPVVIGDDNWIGAGAVIGAPPEVRSHPHPREEGEPAGNGVRIGDRTTIREYVQIHQGWKSETRIGDDVFLMNQVYVAHDGELGAGVTLASSVLLAGHVRIGAGANLGLGTSVHQFREIGRGSMVGMGSVVTTDLPPYAKAFGNPARVRGANVVGMERSGVEPALTDVLAVVYAGGVADLSSIPDREIRVAVEAWTARSGIAQ